MQANERIKIFLQTRRDAGLLRSLQISPGQIDFSSNDYLGFSRSAWIAQRTREILSDYRWEPQGATASRLLNGNTQLLETIEEEIALFHQSASALIFNSGYDANVGLISTLARPEDSIFLDEHAHASIFQGSKLSGAQTLIFKHNDVPCLTALLQNEHDSGIKWVVTESLFSMDGDRAPLKQLADVCSYNNANLIVDEAHATGIFGPLGSGLCMEEGIAESCFARVYTFGKAMGAQGAAVVVSPLVKEYLINYAKPFIYSTALPVHSLARLRATYQYLQYHHRQHKKLFDLITLFEAAKVKIPYRVIGEGPVYGVVIPGNEKVRLVAKTLLDGGFDARPIVSPTVRKGTERIRISLHSFNTGVEIEALTAILASN